MNAIPDLLAELSVPVEGLKHYGGNPRAGDVSAIVESLETNGQYRPIVVNQRTDEVLAGNHTLKAARELGWTQIAATYVDVDDEQAKRIVLVDNRSNDLAGYEDQALVDLLSSLDDLTGTGFDQAALDELLGSVTSPVTRTDPDDAPDVPVAAKSSVGDTWLLGPHKVTCADATISEPYEILLNDVRVDMVWTDPPYGVAYTGKTKEALTIENDSLDRGALEQFLRDAFGLALAHSRPGAAWYVAAPHGPVGLAFSVVLTELDVWRHSLVWVKNTFAMGRADYHYRHEPIYYGWVPGESRLHPVPDRKQDTVWEFDKPSRNADHPTMKPVGLIAKALENSSNPGGVVLDPFGGSGSTLIACHQTGRHARLVELDPRYVDVICRRYQEHTGTMPVLDATGEPHDFTG